MADVDTDDHDSLLLEDSGELGSDGLAVQLGVDLLHDVGGLGKIQSVGGRPEQHLRQDALAGVSVLGDLVVLSVAEDLNGKELPLRMLRVRFHLSQDMLDPCLEISLALRQFVSFDVLAPHAELTLAVLETLESILGAIVVSPVADDEDERVLELVALEDGQLLEQSLRHEELLVASKVVLQFGNCEGTTLKDLRVILNGDVPFFPLTLLEQVIDHLLNRFHFLRWVLLDSVEEFAHLLGAAPDGIWDAIEKAELWRNENVFVALFDDEQRLTSLRHTKAVLLVVILCDTDLGTVSALKEGFRRSLIKVDIMNYIGSLDTVVGDDA